MIHLIQDKKNTHYIDEFKQLLLRHELSNLVESSRLHLSVQSDKAQQQPTVSTLELHCMHIYKHIVIEDINSAHYMN